MIVMAYLVRFKPYETPIRNRVEIINEIFFMLFTYSLIPFTEPYTLEKETKFKLGYVSIGISIGYLIFNFLYIVSMQLSELKKAFFSFKMFLKRCFS